MLDLYNMRKQVKRALCKHDYNTIATHKMSRANLWKCEKCGDIGIQNYAHNYWLPHWNDNVNIDDWISWPSGKELTKEEL